MRDGVELPAGVVSMAAPVPGVDPGEAADLELATSARFPTVPELAVPDGREAAPGRRALEEVLDRLGEDALGVRVEEPGPVSLTLALRRTGVSDEGSVDAALRCVRERVDEVLERTRAALGDRLVLLVLREPGLVGAMHPTFALTRGRVHGLLATAVSAIDRHRASGPLLIGVQTPGPTDWSTVAASGASVLAVPVGPSGPPAGVVDDFLRRGGRIAWGAVPVDRPLGTADEVLWRGLTGHWADLESEGVDPVVLRRRSLVSTVDGLSRFGPSQARRAHELAAAIGARVHREVPHLVGV